MFPGTLGHSIAGKALNKKIWSYSTLNIRDFAIDSYGTVDDVPFGGGAGMVLKPDVIGPAIESLPQQNIPLIYFTPRGQKITQHLIKELSQKPGMNLLCGRYEGIDERIFQHYNIVELSLGDFVLSGGELPALALMDAVIRLLPNVMGKEESYLQESFENDLLEHSLYTKPVQWKDFEVPSVLRSGNHAEIEAWKTRNAIATTKERRPDLWVKFLEKKLSSK